MEGRRVNGRFKKLPRRGQTPSSALETLSISGAQERTIRACCEDLDEALWRMASAARSGLLVLQILKGFHLTKLTQLSSCGLRAEGSSFGESCARVAGGPL